MAAKSVQFRIISVNVRGVSNEVKRKAIFEQHRCNADILVMQETHSTTDCEKIWESEWGGKALFSHGSSAARGVAVFMTKIMYDKIQKVHIEQDGRLIIFDLEEGDQMITVTVVYAPNEDSPEFFKHVQKLLMERHEHKIIIGDFNLTLDVDKDRLNTYHNNNKAMEEVENLMDQYYLYDLWRTRNPEKREYSWRKGGSLNKASRIDLALVSAGLDQYAEYIQYLSSIKTDHRAIYMVINMLPYERGTGYWKFNNSLLRDQDFLISMEQEIQNTINSSGQKTPIEIWETVKSRIKKTSIDYSKKKSSEDKIVIGQLSEIVNEYEERLPLTKEETHLLDETKADLEEKLMERTKGIIFRSKVKWQEEGEKNTKYFFSLEKARYNSKTCFK